MPNIITHRNGAREFALVEVPEGADNFRTAIREEIFFTVPPHTNRDCQYITSLPFEESRAIGLADSIGEEQAMDIVEGKKFFWNNYEFDFYKNWWAKNSLYSLCRSHGMDPARVLIIEKIK